MFFRLLIGVLVAPLFFAGTCALAEELECTRYVPTVGKTVRVRCDDSSAPPAAATPPADTRPPAPPPVVDAPPASPPAVATPPAAPEPSEIKAASTCLNEPKAGTAVGICQVFLANNAGLSDGILTSVYNKLAFSSLQLKDYQSTLTWSKKSLDIAPDAVEYYIAGQAYAGLKDPNRAIVEFSAALLMAPQYLLALHRRGEAYSQVGDDSLARSDFEAALAINAKFTPSVEALRRVKKRG